MLPVKSIKFALLVSLFNHVTHPTGDKHVEVRRGSRKPRKPEGANIVPASNRCLDVIFDGVARLNNICRCNNCI